MRNIIRKIYEKEAFNPSWLFGIWINPAFIVRRNLLRFLDIIINPQKLINSMMANPFLIKTKSLIGFFLVKYSSMYLI